MQTSHDHKVILELIQAAAIEYLPAGALDTRAEIVGGYIGPHLAARLSTYILSEKLAEDTQTESTQVPASWWDHLKSDLNARTVRPGWRLPRRLFWRWLDAHPVQYRVITLHTTWKRSATRPHSTIRVDKGLGPVVYVEQASAWIDNGTATS